MWLSVPAPGQGTDQYHLWVGSFFFSIALPYSTTALLTTFHIGMDLPVPRRCFWRIFSITVNASGNSITDVRIFEPGCTSVWSAFLSQDRPGTWNKVRFPTMDGSPSPVGLSFFTIDLCYELLICLCSFALRCSLKDALRPANGFLQVVVLWDRDLE